MGVRDKVIIVTGAARGIGQEYVRAMAAHGALMVAADVIDCSETMELVRKVGSKVLAVRLDVTQAQSAEAMAEAAATKFGRIDGF